MKVTTTTIRASSRASVKIKDNYFTVEFCEEQTVEDCESEEELQRARQQLWDTVNGECDAQIIDIKNTFNK